MADTQEQQNIINRVSQLPVVMSAYDLLSDYYTRAKEYNSLTKATLDTAEKSIKFAADQAKPVVSKLEKPIAFADSAACKTLDLIQEKCPVVTKTPEEIAKETKELYNSTLQPTLNRVTGAKDFGYEKVTAVKDYSLEKANQLLNTKYGQMLGNSVSKTLNVADQYVDYYLPSASGNEEETKPKTDDAMGTRVNKLSNKLKHRVHKMTLQQMEHVQKRTQDTLSHLNVVLDLVQLAKNNLNPANLALRDRLNAAQIKAAALWEELKKEETDEKQVGLNDEKQTLENKSLNLARQLTKQLMNVYSSSSQMLPSVPEQLQPALEQSRQYVAELYNQISQIKSIEEATGVVVLQIREKSKLIQDTMSSLLEHAAKLQPLEWLFTEITIDDIFLEDDPDEPDGSNSTENMDSSYYQHRPRWMS